jgi:hypothetical protein
MNRESPDTGSSLVVSYLTLRKAVGILGIALPFVLAFGGMLIDKPGIQSSISSYYHTGMRDIFVGTLCAIAVFLMSYKGYEPKDDRAGVLACIFAVGVALLPTAPDSDPTSRQKLIGHFHLLFAVLFFLTLAYFSLRLFTKTDKTKVPTRRKLQRNVVYKACGYTMLAALILIVILAFLQGQAILEVKRLALVFWLESIAIVAFGISWLTKGEAILKDET